MLKDRFFYTITVLIFLSGVFFSCRRHQSDPYTAQKLPQAERDTLLVDLIARVYSLPEGQTGFNPQRLEERFRPYFISQKDKFDLLYYHVRPDSTHLFFMIRPARNAKNQNRGVGGRFRRGTDGKMMEFEELFVTPHLQEDTLRMRGKELFYELVKKGNVDMYLPSPAFVEWPNNLGAYYDKTRLEWRYTPPSTTEPDSTHSASPSATRQATDNSAH